MLSLLPTTLFALVLLTAAYSDLTTMKIPNWTSIALAVSFPIAALIGGATFGAIGLHIAFGFAVLVVCFLLNQAGIFGGGDAKLIAAVSVWTGISAFLPFILWTAMAGGLLAMVLLLARQALPGHAALPAFVNRLLMPQTGIPYGLAILVGGLAAIEAMPFRFSALTLP